MSIFAPGVLVTDDDGRVGMIIDYPDKKPLVGHVYKVLFQEGLEWVYPENINLLAEKSRDRKER